MHILRRQAAFAALLLLSSGCDGQTVCVGCVNDACDAAPCPAGTVFHEPTEACEWGAAVDACDGLADGDPCEFPGVPNGTCRDSVCSPCGDNVMDAGEQCDGTDLPFTQCTALGVGFVSGSLACAECRFDRSDCDYDWVTVPAGSFTMGSPPGELGRIPEEVAHAVTLSGSFQMLATEVTQGMFADRLGETPSTQADCGSDCPVESVSWHDAAAYCNALSDAQGLARCYDCSGSPRRCATSASQPAPYDCPGYRLPSEAEWEFAARAGTQTATYNGDLEPGSLQCVDPVAVLEAIAWYCGNSGDLTWPVGQLDANALGLFDMLGNVYEWGHDWYQVNYETLSATDPLGLAGSGTRVQRGASHGSNPRYCRAAYRDSRDPDSPSANIGFRPVRSLP